ncbi:hypothetical protein GCM10023237_02820 [Streptomyces coeruleoprunus]
MPARASDAAVPESRVADIAATDISVRRVARGVGEVPGMRKVVAFRGRFRAARNGGGDRFLVEAEGGGGAKGARADRPRRRSSG